MSQMQSVAGSAAGAGPMPATAASIPIVTLGLSLSLFFVISYVICIVGYLLAAGFPRAACRAVDFFAGVRTAELGGAFPGHGESFIWGWYIALVFGLALQFFQPAPGALSKGAAQ